MKWSRKRVLVFIIVALTVAIVTAGGVYWGATKQEAHGGPFQMAPDRPLQTTTSVASRSPANGNRSNATRASLSREELIAHEWEAANTGLTATLDELQRQHGEGDTPDVVVKDSKSGREVARISTAGAVAVVDEYIRFRCAPVLRGVNDLMQEVYVDEICEKSTRDLFPNRYAFALSFDGDVRLLAESEYYTVNPVIRLAYLAPDKTSLSLISYEQAPGNIVTSTLDEELPSIRKMVTIIDLLSGHAEKFPLPDTIDEVGGTEQMLPISYRFASNDVIEVLGKRIADDNKELWGYNKKSGKLTLIEVVPSHRATTTPAGE